MSQKAIQSIINVNDLNSGYGNSHILFGVDFEAKEKEITIVVGPNGSGKSTLLKSIFGLCSIYSGEITYSGDKISGLAPHDIARKKIAYLPQVDNVFANLTIKENLLMASYTLNSAEFTHRLPEIYETFPVLKKYEKTKAESLSGGERQMLAMAMALIRQPKLMLFDEPTASLSPKLADEVLTKIKHLRDEFGITIILVEQNVKRALKIGDQVFLYANGKGVFSGNPSELLEHPELSKLYLGVS
ncbi:MAG: ATP-binding cassette domain-containing protein [Nitrososphaeria archaeon]|nr:ATP-binding cassette domain-containing protein [Nitrosopumilaceae archaeon]NIP10160.1 ATP-binding cassette domain-containing protein [Nitrosopumilaceae archaeon]NIP91524.1 ATP-binding cassette domain-containing protein [Nitrososphaeria archaeon]NIS95359.1 ATP-binding cassette domain-containing protein [Nitrosopumilaceae archaeon]